MKPTLSRVFRAGTGSPKRRTSPPVGRINPIRILMVVVLPAPFGPRKPYDSPRDTSKLMPRTASTRRIQKPWR